MALAPIDLTNVAAGTGGFVIYGQDGTDTLGRSVASAGDVNGDGFDDLIIGAPGGDGAGNATSNAGDSYVVFGQSGGFGATVDLAAIAAGTGGFVLYGQDSNDQAGFSVTAAGDINGDGVGDLIVGAFGANGPGNARAFAGDTYVVFGRTSGFGASIALADIAAGTGGFVIFGEDAQDQSGRSVASAGDINGDGFDDLIIGAYLADGAANAKSNAGDAYVLFGKASGFGASIDLATVAAGTGGFVIHGQDANDRAGGTVASAGDVNGDGYDDLLIAASNGDGAANGVTNSGESYVVFGKASGFGASIDLTDVAAGTGGFVVYGVEFGDYSALSVASAGDINGDGFSDIVIGAVTADGTANGRTNSGESYVVFGKSGGFGASIALSDVVAGTGGFVILGQDAGDRSGYSVASAGDVNGDGIDDLIIGATLAAAAGNAKSQAGDSYVVFGSAGGFGASIDLVAIAAGTGGFVINGADASDQSGRSVAGAGDIDGDGFDDLIIGAFQGDGAGNLAGNAGDSYVIFGRDFSGTVTHQGTTASETLTGSAAADDMVAGLGNDILDGKGGADALSGGAGNDTIKVADLGFLRVDGGSGTDTLALDGAGMTLDLSTIADSKLRDIEVIDLTGSGNNGLILSALEVLNLSTTSNTLRVEGNAWDALSFGAETWTHTKTSGGYATFTNGQAIVEVNTAVSVVLPAIDLTNVAAGTGGFVIHGQDGGDRSGWSVASAGDINGDGFGDLIIGAPRADAVSNGTYNAGDTYVVFGQSGGFGASVDLATIAAGTGGFVLFGQDVSDQSGFSAASAGDINGDGFDDLIIGARSGDAASNAKSNAGDTYVVFGQSGGFGASVDLTTIAAGTGGFVILGKDAGDQAGWSVASAGDIDGDGLDDLIIGARDGDADSNARANAGDTYVVFGQSGGFGASIDLSTIAAGTGGFVVFGQDVNDYAGSSVASAGDINGDGFDDLIIGAHGGDAALNGKPGAGDTYVVFGQSGGFGASVDLTTIAAGTGGFVIFGQDGGDRSGWSVASAGDVNGDGFDDLIIGARYADAASNGKSSAGDSYVVFGRSGGFGASVDLTTIAAGTGGFVIYGQDAGDQAGFSVASAGDINGDGYDDLIIGAFGGDAGTGGKYNAGDSYVVFGKSGGFGASVDLATIAAGTGGFVIFGQDASDRAGFSVASAGDIDGDGFDDLIIGAYVADGASNAKSEAGDSYVVFGRDFSATLTHLGTTASETLTGSAAADDMVAGLGDDILDGKGGADALLGGAGNDTIKIADLTFLRVDGGSGTDTLALDGAGMTLDLSAIANPKLQNIEVIDLTGSGNNGLTLSALEVLNLSTTSNTLRVEGNAGDTVSFGAETWTHSGISGGYRMFTNGQAVVEVNTAVSTVVSVVLPAIDLTNVAAGTGGFVIFGEDADDRSGVSVASAGDINGDGFDDLIIGARYGDGAANGKANAGDTYVVFGKSGGFGASVDLTTIAAGTGGFVLLGQDTGDQAGRSVASAGDINGDGFDDLIIGAPRADAASNGKASAGDTYVVFGQSGGFGASIDLATIAAGTGGFVLFGQDAADQSGISVASAGDLNGDGFDDLIIGAYRGDAASNGKIFAGDSYVVFGQSGGFGASVDLATIAAGTGGFVIFGQDIGDQSGGSVASAGDINGDGFDDLIIGARYGDGAANGKGDAGDSYVIFGKSDGFGAPINLTTIAAGTGGFVIFGQDAADRSGWSVASAGDLNGDGFDDLIIGAYRGDAASNAKSTAGDIYVVFGQSGGFGASVDLATIAAGTGGFVLFGEDAFDQSGFSVASAGDLNGDGFDDLIIGAPFADAASNAKSGVGDSYVVFGQSGGFGASIDLATIAAGTGGFVIYGQDADDRSGWTVASAGDIDGDGFDDLIIGAPYADAASNAKSSGGDSYVIFGRDFTATVTHLGTTASETLTGSAAADDMVAGLGDDILDGKGGADALLGGAGDDTIKIADLTFLRVDGGSGTDTLALDGAGMTLDLSTIANPKLQNIEVIDLTGAGNNTLILSKLEVLNLSSTSNTLKVEGNKGDTADIGVGTWTKTGPSGGYVTYTNGQANVLIHEDISVACFAEGTRIATETGDVVVEALRVGDRVRLASGGLRPIRWIGHRHLDLVRHPDPARVRPIRIEAGAFADDMPARALRVSPDHALSVDGVLIAARLLVNHATIARETTCASVTYYHIELDAHDVLLAEGLPAESYLDTGNRGVFDNAGVPMTLHPDLSGQEGRRAASCQPFVDAAEQVKPIWDRLANRAVGLGWDVRGPVVSRDPDVRIEAGARVLHPVSVEGDCYTFVLPPGCAAVRLTSNAASPAEMEPWREDRRRLGLSVRRIRVGGEDLPLDHPGLSAGWWGLERHGGAPVRWTDGAALLEVGAGGARVLEITAGRLAGYGERVAAARPVVLAA